MIDIANILIQKAVTKDSAALTEIAFAAKKHWDYPPQYYELWKDELTITPDYICTNHIYKAAVKEEILGFYSIIENKADFYSGEILVKKGFWLEHIFISPAFHKLGIGTLLINHAKLTAQNLNVNRLLIFVDPFAKGFYDKIGAEFLYESKSSIPGRMIPVYELKITD